MQTGDDILFTAPGPDPIPTATTEIVGTPGNALNVYWIVSHFPIGSVVSGPFPQKSSPNLLDDENYVLISWLPTPGASSYDLLFTRELELPRQPGRFLLAANLTQTSFRDRGDVLQEYDLAGVPLGAPQEEHIYFNNRDFKQPTLQFIPWPIQVSSIIFEDGSSQNTAGGGGLPAPPDRSVQFNDNQAFGGSGDLIWDNLNSRLGIGTQNPQGALDIATPNQWVVFRNQVGTTIPPLISEGGLFLGRPVGTGGVIGWIGTELQLIDFTSGSPIERMTISPGGRTDINTSIADNSAMFRLGNPFSGLWFGGDYTGFWIDSASYSLVFKTLSVEHMRIDSTTGSVLIGSMTPDSTGAALQVTTPPSGAAANFTFPGGARTRIILGAFNSTINFYSPAGQATSFITDYPVNALQLGAQSGTDSASLFAIPTGPYAGGQVLGFQGSTTFWIGAGPVGSQTTENVFRMGLATETSGANFIPGYKLWASALSSFIAADYKLDVNGSILFRCGTTGEGFNIQWMTVDANTGNVTFPRDVIIDRGYTNDIPSLVVGSPAAWTIKTLNYLGELAIGIDNGVPWLQSRQGSGVNAILLNPLGGNVALPSIQNFPDRATAQNALGVGTRVLFFEDTTGLVSVT